MVKVNFIPRLEDGGFRIEEVDEKGFIDGSIDIKQEELHQLMKEVCEEDNELLDALRFCYQHFEVKSIVFKKKENL